MYRFVLDANVVRAALCSPEGPSAKLLSNALSEEVVLLTSFPLFIEYESMCMHRALWEPSGLAGWQVGDFLDGLAALMRVVSIPSGWLPKLSDVVSELSLLTAVEGDADGIVSLGELSFSDQCANFDVELLTPQQAVARIQHA